MREITFRAKSLDGIWEYGDLHLRCKHPHMHNLNGAKIYIDDNTIGQFTGLHDKNGKEIYEGDIVKDIEFGIVGYIAFHEQSACFRIVFSKSDMALGNRGISTTFLEVITNVHDNPELLKGGEQ